MTDRSIVTLNQVKSYLKDKVSNTEHDDFLNGSDDSTVLGMIQLVSEEFEAETGQYVQPLDVEVILCGEGGSELKVPYWPVIQLFGADEATRLANLQYRNSIASGWTDVASDEDYVWIDPLEPWKIKILEGDGFFPRGQATVRVKYIAGYSSIPADITLAVIERVAIKYEESKRGNRLGVDSGGSGGGMGSQNFSYNDLEERWQKVVAKYRKWQ